jgi:hypothetical protein
VCVQLASAYNCTLASALLPLPAAPSGSVATSNERRAPSPTATAQLTAVTADRLADVGLPAGFGVSITPRPSLRPTGWRTCACARDARGIRPGCVYAHVHVQRARPACLRARVICFGVCTYVSVTPSPTRKPTAPATHAPSGPMSKECQQVPPYLTKPGANHCIPLGMVPQCAASIIMRKRLAQNCIRRDMVSLTARSDGVLDCTTPFAPAQDTLPAAPFQCRCATSTKSHKASRMLNAASPLSHVRRCDAARTRAEAPTGLAWDWAAGL